MVQAGAGQLENCAQVGATDNEAVSAVFNHFKSAKGHCRTTALSSAPNGRRATRMAEGPPSFSRLLLPTVVPSFFRALPRIVLAKKKLRKHARARIILLVIKFK